MKAIRSLKDKVRFAREYGWLRDIRVRYILLSVLLNFTVEAMSRHSVWKGLLHVLTRPHIFIYNTLIVLAVISIGMFLRRRYYATFLLSLVFLVPGLINCIALTYKKTPLTFYDFGNTIEAIRVLPKYIPVIGIILLGLLIVFIIFLIVFAAFKLPKAGGKIEYLSNGIFCTIVGIVLASATFFGVRTGVLDNSFENMMIAYRENGFNYCFIKSAVSSGISRPADYSADTVDEVVTELEEESGGENTREMPNIIFVQLESFFDPTTLNSVTFSEDPIPEFRNIAENYPSGALRVPSFGAGTANTEFEVLTGINLDDFAPGEYPYKTILQEKACESAAYNLKQYGYCCSAMHDNDGDFYDRNKAYPQLGFDSFTSLEYMNNYELTYTGWAKDEVLIHEIMDLMKSTEEKDFIFAVSVEGHGDYPDELTEDMDLTITASDPDNVTGSENSLTYYVNQINDMDYFISYLIGSLQSTGEEVVLVLYGDHLPAFDLENEEVSTGNICQTQYVIWNNMGLENEKEDLEAYQLSARVMSLLGLEGGMVDMLHQDYLNNGEESEETYLSDLKVLEYDMLYGDAAAYDGEEPYKPTDMKMGYKDIEVTDADNVFSHICVNGTNFTEYSVVFVNDEPYTTMYNGENELIVDQMQLKPGDIITVRQVSLSGSCYLSTSNEYIY